MARIIYAHIIRAVYAEIKVGREDFFPHLFSEEAARSLAICCCPSICHPRSAFRTMAEGFVEICQKCFRMILLL